MLRGWAGVACAGLLALSPGKPVLRPGAAVTAQLVPGQRHAYAVAVEPGAYVRVTGDQKHLDLVLEIRDADGRSATVSDTFDHGEESASAVTERGGRWSVEVSAAPNGAARGIYRISLAARHPATDRDRQRMAAEAASTQVRLLRRSGSLEALKTALDATARAIALWQSLGDRLGELRSRSEQADIHNALNDYEQARRLYGEALALSRSAGDARSEAEILNNLAIGYWQQGRTHEALEHLAAARAIFDGIEDTNGRGATLSNLGLLYWQTGQSRDALTYLEQALRTLQAAAHRRGEAYVHNNIAVAHVSLGDFGKALESFGRAIPLFQTSGDSVAAGRAWSAQAKVYLLAGDVPAARRSIERAFAGIRRAGDKRGLAEALNNLARIGLAEKDLPAALDSASRALAGFREIGDRRGEGISHQILGSIRLALGRPEEALASFESALERFRTAGARDNQAAALYAAASIRRDAGQTEQAREALEAAIELIESLRSEAPGDRLRAGFLASKLDCYHAYIDLLLQMDRSQPDPSLRAKAFRVSEQARARTMLDLLRARRWDLLQDANAELVEEGKRLQRELSYSLERIGRAPAAGGAAKVDDLLARLRVVEDRIVASSPRAGLLFAPVQPDIEAIRRDLLDEETALIEFSLGEPRSYVFVLDRDTFAAMELPGESEIDKAAGAVAEILQRRENPRTALARLGRLLFGRVPLRARRLLIVADGRLHYVPFAAVPDPATGEPLAVRHEIVSAPSAAVLMALRETLKGRPAAPRRLAAIADPVYDSNDARIAPALRRQSGPADYSRLVFARRGAAAISSRLAADDRLLLMDFDADKQKLLETALDRYRIVHFDVHSAIDEATPDLSGLVLTLVGPDGRPRDGFLRLAEIFRLRLAADFAVLAACRTSIGRQVRGEGLLALTRGFLYAGAAGVVASLWPVDDEASAELMQHFYRALFASPGMRPAAALRQAQLALRAQPRWREPYYWAAYGFQGLEAVPR